MSEILDSGWALLNHSIFVLGETTITPVRIIYFLLLTILLVFVSGKLRNLLIARLLERTSLQRGVQQSIGTVSRYIMLFVGFIIILQTVGIDLTTVSVLAGAIGIGIGLGLQMIANNFISGLILLFERPINIGDRIEVGEISGDVVSIGARSTRIRTNDNIAIIVPNSKLVSENVTNWSYEGSKVRFDIPVVVPVKSDIELIRGLLIEAAEENPDVLDTPKPTFRCINFDDELIHLELRAWSETRLHHPDSLKSALNLAILQKFREQSIDPYSLSEAK